MINDRVLSKIHNYYPDFKIDYKDKSILMKIIGKLSFFSPSFMIDYTTTIGETTYFPTLAFVDKKPITALVVLLHELVHVYDEKRLGKIIFGLSYLFPQILFIPALFLFVLSWKIAIPLLFIFLLPFPAYFRMIHEKRAYFASLYCMSVLNKKSGYNIDLKGQGSFFREQFVNSCYYFMWPFKNLEVEFENAISMIEQGKRPYEDKIFDVLDDILSVV